MGLLAIGLVLGACGGALDPEQARQERIAEQMRASYASSLERLKPAFLLVTYPGTIGSMPDQKRREMDLVHRILDERGIPHEVMDRNQVCEKVTINKTVPEDRAVYRVPVEIAEKYRGKTIIYLNLDVRDGLESARHPDVAEYGLNLLLWNDPVKIAAPRAST